MKNILTTALLIGLFAFTSNSFADTPSEYMTLLYQQGAKELYLINSKGEVEKVLIEGRSLEDGLRGITIKINQLAHDGWEVEEMTVAAGSNFLNYTYLLAKE